MCETRILEPLLVFNTGILKQIHVRTGHHKPEQFPGVRRGRVGDTGQDASASEGEEEGGEYRLGRNSSRLNH